MIIDSIETAPICPARRITHHRLHFIFSNLDLAAYSRPEVFPEVSHESLNHHMVSAPAMERKVRITIKVIILITPFVLCLFLVLELSTLPRTGPRGEDGKGVD